MKRRVWCVVATGVAMWLAGTAPAFGSHDLEAALSLLPEVSAWERDPDGDLAFVAGRLTPDGPAQVRSVARSFLHVHRHLFGAANGSEFEVESVWRAGDRALVSVRQSVDGFAATGERLELEFRGSVLQSVAGRVLKNGDLPPPAVDRMSPQEARAVALSLLGPTMTERTTTAERILWEASHRRCWRIETVADSGVGTVLQTAVIDVDQRAVIHHVVLPLSDAGGGGAGNQPPQRSDGCEAVVPPVGGYGTAVGHAQWTGADLGCGRWEFDARRRASLFHGDCLEHVCQPFPSTEYCDHGEIRRDGLQLAAGLERVELRVLEPDRELFMRLRWGPGANQAAPFMVWPAPHDVATVEIDLGAHESWDSAKVDTLTLELVDDHQVWLRRLDVWPGPWLEFANGPEVVTDPPGGALVEGEPVTVLQDVRNTGCALESGTEDDMRAVEYILREVVEAGGGRSQTVCSGASIGGGIEAGSELHDLPMCAFDLPQAGVWQLEARFVSHPSPPALSVVEVAPALFPDLGVDIAEPIDLYSGHLGAWPCRSDLLDLTRWDDPNPPCALPWVIAVALSAEGLDAPQTARLELRGRPVLPSADPDRCDPTSAGWYPLAAAVTVQLGNGGGLVEVPLERSLLEAIPMLAGGWSMLDLSVELEPVAGEVELDNNTLCLESWIPVADGSLSTAIGPTWVEDDYFVDPEHWPPHGLAWTGLEVVHEEGAASHDPDSALLRVSVTDGANEQPRLVWFEERPGDAVTGALVRYRRGDRGFGVAPFLEAGAEEADGIPDFELETGDHRNRAELVTDSQWRTVLWRRGSSGPFGGHPVPVFATPGTSGSTVSLHATPDSNCLLDEVGCPSGLYPTTSLDVVAVWMDAGSPPPSPVYALDGLRVLDGGLWVWPPAQVSAGQQLQYAVAVRNVGTASGTAVLSASVDILSTDENPSVHHMTGAATVAIGPGDMYPLTLAPPWLPQAAGGYVVIGPVNESGEWIGTVQQPIEVVADPVPCPVPAVNLP